MRDSRRMIVEAWETPHKEHDGLSYRIQFRLLSDGVWQQRHIFYHGGEPEYGQWISIIPHGYKPKTISRGLDTQVPVERVED